MRGKWILEILKMPKLAQDVPKKGFMVVFVIALHILAHLSSKVKPKFDR